MDAVKFHVGNALHKLGMSSRRELARWRGRPADSAQQHRNERNTTMTDLSLGPIGQISRPMRDVAAAADWYGKTLRLPHLYTFGELAFFDCGGIRLMLSPPETGAESAPSLLYFKVDDINAAYDELTRRGVTFKGAPHLVHRHDSGVEEWMAFFTDPEDNLLAVMSLEGGS